MQNQQYLIKVPKETAAGGGGWYGGYAYQQSGLYSNASGAGGSGYIGGVSNGTMTVGNRTGNGYARITNKNW